MTAYLKSKSLLLLCCLVGLLLVWQPPVLQAEAVQSSPGEILLSPGEKECSITVIVTLQEACAGIEFAFDIGTEDQLQFNRFELSDALKKQGAIPTPGGILPTGFFAGSNRFSERIEAGKLYFTYTGNDPLRIALTRMKVFRIAGQDQVGSTSQTSGLFEATVKRRSGGVNGSGDNNDNSASPNTGTGATNNIIVEIIEAPGVPLAQRKSSKYFDDVKGGFSWAVDVIDGLYEKGVVKGIGQRLYGPATNITRCDFIAMLVRAFDLKSSFTDNFSDVPPGSYYYEAVGIAKALGIAIGDNNKFQPRQPISRQDTMALLQRIFVYKNKALPPGSDSDLQGFSDQRAISPYARSAVATLVKAKLIVGDDGKINPLGYTTRAEMAAVLYRALEYLEQ